MSGFKEPNYTQTPNDFFTMLPEMSDAELRVTTVMIRETFGWHRATFKMSIPKLAKAAGLCDNAARAGAAAAESRGTFKRVNPDAQGEAEWELVVEFTPPASSEGGAASEGEGVQPVQAPPASAAPHPRVERNIKKGKKTPFSYPLGWKVATGEAITEEDLAAEKHKEMTDTARDVAESVLGNGERAFQIVLAFQEEMDVVIPKGSIKKQAIAVHEMVEWGVTVEHVRKAIQKMKKDGLPIADLHSVVRMAEAEAHKTERIPEWQKAKAL